MVEAVNVSFYYTISVCDRRVGVGDVVVLKDPMSIEKYLVRRLAAIEGYEMASIDEKDEPFVLERDQCWLLSDNENLKTKVYAPSCLMITSFVSY